MSMPSPERSYTVDEYLTLERAAFERHIYLDGQIFAMAGETDAHGDISVNLVISLGSQLKETPCRARTKDTKVRSGRIPLSGKSMRGLFSYPDIVVVCGEPEYPDASATFTIGSHLLNDAPYREYSPRKRKGRRQLPPAQ